MSRRRRYRACRRECGERPATPTSLGPSAYQSSLIYRKPLSLLTYRFQLRNKCVVGLDRSCNRNIVGLFEADGRRFGCPKNSTHCRRRSGGLLLPFPPLLWLNGWGLFQSLTWVYSLMRILFPVQRC